MEKWLNRLVIFALRKKLGLKKRERFRFSNQKSHAVYYFNNQYLMKIEKYGGVQYSGVKFNWLMSDDCEVERYDSEED